METQLIKIPKEDWQKIVGVHWQGNQGLRLANARGDKTVPIEMLEKVVDKLGEIIQPKS